MEIFGRLNQSGVSTVDETLVFASKTASRNFYLQLPNTIPASATIGYWIPYNGKISMCIATNQNIGTAKKAIAFNIMRLENSSILGTIAIPDGAARVYIPDMNIEVPSDTTLAVYATGANNVTNPIVRILISKK